MRNEPKKRTVSEDADLRETSQIGATATHLIEFTEQTLLAKEERRIRREMFDQIDSPEPLDPIKAAQAWIELRAVYSLVKQLKKLKKAGDAANSRLSGAQVEAQDTP